MNAAQDALRSIVRFLNQPLVKEGIKKVAGFVTFAFGICEIYDITQILKGKDISTDNSASFFSIAINNFLTSSPIATAGWGGKS